MLSAQDQIIPLALAHDNQAIASIVKSPDELLAEFFDGGFITRDDVNTMRELCLSLWKDTVRLSESKGLNKYELVIQTMTRQTMIEVVIYCDSKMFLNAVVSGVKHTQYDLNGKTSCVSDNQFFDEPLTGEAKCILRSCQVTRNSRDTFTIKRGIVELSINERRCGLLKTVSYTDGATQATFGTRLNASCIIETVYGGGNIESLVHTGYILSSSGKQVYLDGKLVNLDTSLVPEKYLSVFLQEYTRAPGLNVCMRCVADDSTEITCMIEGTKVTSVGTLNRLTGWRTQTNKRAKSIEYKCTEYSACVGRMRYEDMVVHTSRFVHNLFDNNTYTYLHRVATRDGSVLYEAEYLGGDVVVYTQTQTDEPLFLLSVYGVEFAATQCVIGPCLCVRSGPVGCRSCGSGCSPSTSVILCRTCNHRCCLHDYGDDDSDVCETIHSTDGNSTYTFTYSFISRGNANKKSKKIVAVETSNGSIQSIDQHNYDTLGNSTNIRSIDSDNMMSVKTIGSKDMVGGLIGYKAAKTTDNRMCVVKLMIPRSARVAWDINKDKYRADSAIVMSIKHVQFKKVNGKVKHYYDDDLEVKMCHVCAVEKAEFMSHPCRHKACGNCWKTMLASYQDTCCFCRQVVTHVEKVEQDPLTTISVEMLDVASDQVPMVFVDGISSRLPKEEIKEAYTSIYTDSFRYRVGDLITIPDFDTNLGKPCAPGIHFHEKDTDIFQWFEYMDVPAYLVDTPVQI